MLEMFDFGIRHRICHICCWPFTISVIKVARYIVSTLRFISEFDNGSFIRGISECKGPDEIALAWRVRAFAASLTLWLVRCRGPLLEVLLFWTDCRLSSRTRVTEQQRAKVGMHPYSCASRARRARKGMHFLMRSSLCASRARRVNSRKFQLISKHNYTLYRGWM